MDDTKFTISELKRQLISKGEATSLFASERDDDLSSIWGSLGQTIFGEPAYPTVELKTVLLSYFVTKKIIHLVMAISEPQLSF